MVVLFTYTCSASIHKTQLMQVALIFFINSLFGKVQVQMNVLMRWIVVQMTDEYKVHGAFILIDLLKGTSTVSSQGLIG